MDVNKNTITEKLDKLIPIFAKASVGDFSQDVERPEADDEFAQLYEGIQIMLNVIRDKIATLEAEIKARKLMQDELYRQRQDFKALADDSPDIIARFDRELRHVYVNPAIQKVTGYARQSFLGKTNKELNMPEEQEHYWADSITKVFQTGQEARIEFNFRSPDQQIRYFQARLVPEKAPDGSIQYVLGVSHDITELKKRTEELEEERVKDQAILSNIGDGLVVTDESGKIVLMNQVAQDLLGWSTKEVVGKVFTEIVPMEDQQEHLIQPQNRPMSLSLTSNKKISATYYYKKRDNTRFPASMTVTPLLVSSGIVGSIEIFRDVTKEKELEHAKDEFISLVSHELRTPMTAVKGLVSMVLKGDYGELTERLKQPLTNVYTSAERQIHLINDLLNISRLQTGRIKYTLLNFSFEKIGQEVVNSLQMIAKQKKIALTIETKQDTFVQGDDIWVKELLNNLIGNAIKFTQNGGVTITYRIDSDQAAIVITDTGSGITLADQEKLFGKFEQLNSPEVGKAVGSGLGLFIAREVSRKMGGDVLLEKSIPGQGSTFVMTLPKANTPRAEAVKKELEKEMELALNKKE